MRSRDDDIKALKELFLQVPRRPDEWVRASENTAHFAAVLADAALQPGVNYSTVVTPRVAAIVARYPQAATLSGLQKLLASVPAAELLRNPNRRKCGVFLHLVELLAQEHVETVDELREWLKRPDAKAKLVCIPGLKHKTAAYMRLLVGLPSVAIDVHLRRAAAGVGVAGSDEELELLFTEAASDAGMSLRDLDASLWQAGSDAAAKRAH